MSELKITIHAPELADAINKLAAALSANPMSAPTAPKVTASQPETAPTTSTTGNNQGAGTTAPAQVTASPAPTTTVPNGSHSEPPKTYSLDDLSVAGAALLEKGCMQQLMDLLGRFGVPALTMLKPEQYGAFAAELRALGANI